MRIGTGWDIHPLVEGRKLVIGGVTVPHTKGEAGHSDGDVLIHAIIDALFGAAALGDIGTHFPPADPAYKNIDSTVLLEKSAALLNERGFGIVNLDTTVILQEPKLKAFIPAIVKKLARYLKVDETCISVKAKTRENLDSTGKGLAIEAQASVLLNEADNSIWV